MKRGMFMRIQRYNKLFAWYILAVFIASTSCAQYVLAQTAAPTVVDLLKQSASSGIEGEKFEQAGNFGDALIKYEDALRFVDRSMDEYSRLAIPFQFRHFVAYWLAGFSHFNAARMKMQLRRSPEDITFHLKRSQLALTATINLDQIAARGSGYQYTANVWKFFNLRAQINLMLGDLIHARSDYALVANTLNKGFRPAVDALAYIDYLEGRSQKTTTPNGLRVPEKPKSKLTQKVLTDLAFEFLKLVFTEYKNEISLAPDVWTHLMWRVE
jgi:hypothetical protein